MVQNLTIALNETGFHLLFIFHHWSSIFLTQTKHNDLIQSASILMKVCFSSQHTHTHTHTHTSAISVRKRNDTNQPISDDYLTNQRFSLLL